MAKALVIVESPAKAKTINKFLGRNFTVKASMGHVRDLPKRTLGVDEKKSFKPTYEVLPGRKKVLDELKKAAEKVDALYIATDPDREGEAIGWHLAQELGISKSKTHRIMFNEITERAVKAAFLHPGKIDTNKVNAQQARRVLDRLVGYKLSPLLWEKIRRGLSAGRVQSVAVRLITEREREIAAFVPVEYWSLHARLKGKNPPDFTATLKEVKGEKADLPNEAETMAVMTALHGAAWTVKSVTRGERRRNPAPPFITSTLQQDASRKLHFSAKKTMMLAQQLYEGVELGEEGAVGLITYMRTDAVRVAAEAQDEARQWVAGRLGQEYLPDAPPTYKAKKSAQEAHEAVRPSSVALSASCNHEPPSSSASDRRAAFVSAVTHELRTPLTQIRGYSDILADVISSAKVNPDHMTQISQGLTRAGQRLEEIITAMLDVSRIDSQGLDIHTTPISIGVVIKISLETYKDAIQERQINVALNQLDDLLPVQGDLQRLTQAFTNLIGNAIKFTPDGSQVTISGHNIEQQSDHNGQAFVEVLIADQGIGIDIDDQFLIFEKFYRVGAVELHSTGSTKFKGAGPGLGLPISKGVIQAHGGKIWVESPGHDEERLPGSVFHVLLPALKVPADVGQQPERIDSPVS